MAEELDKYDFYRQWQKFEFMEDNPLNPNEYSDFDIYDSIRRDGTADQKKSILFALVENFLYSQYIELEDILSATESPIEEKLLGAMILKFQNCAVFWDCVAINDNYECFYNREASYGDNGFYLKIYIQPKLSNKHRVDFLIEEFDAYKDHHKIPMKKLIIECDGHEFHEKTKDQAQKDKRRDREIQHKGYQIFRFNGSEIFKNPFICVDSIYDFFYPRKS